MRPTSKSPKEGKTLRDGKREHERQSGSNETGVKSVDKRNGSGAHNWGNVKDDIKDYNDATKDNSGKTKVVEKNVSIIKEKPEELGSKNSPAKAAINFTGDQIEPKLKNEEGKEVLENKVPEVKSSEPPPSVKDEKSFPILPPKE